MRYYVHVKDGYIKATEWATKPSVVEGCQAFGYDFEVELGLTKGVTCESNNPCVVLENEAKNVAAISGCTT